MSAEYPTRIGSICTPQSQSIKGFKGASDQHAQFKSPSSAPSNLAFTIALPRDPVSPHHEVKKSAVRTADPHKGENTCTSAMPFNALFSKPSTNIAPSSSSSSSSSSFSASHKTPIKTALNSGIFPPSSTTYALICTLFLSSCHPALRSLPSSSEFHHLKPIDVQQLLTEIYGFEPSLHWTWIGCTFAPASVERALGSSSSAEHKLQRSQPKALTDFCKKTQADESARKERILREQGGDAVDAYRAGEKRRRRAEMEGLERCIRCRRGTL
ncbi:MAG: hypothetical protein Q9207_000540 [Kuettlingeria erythrocarpa]